MPRDEFDRLERRWRKRPLFLPRRQRVPRWPLALLVAVLVAVFVWQQPTAGLIERVQQALVASGFRVPEPPQASAEPGGPGTADAGFAQAPDLQQGEPGDGRD
jgi:hypothetical protein